MTFEDRAGHAGYVLLAAGTWFVASGVWWGWGVRMAGSVVWAWVGWRLRLTSVWTWSSLFAVIDARGLVQ